MTNTTDKAMREALELAREYVANASQRMYDGTNGHGIRKEAARRLALIDAALASSAAAPEQADRAQRMRDAGYTRRPTLREMAEPDHDTDYEQRWPNAETPAPAAEAEPVAWQGVHDHSDLYWQKPTQADVRPLYTRPSAPLSEPTAEGVTGSETAIRIWHKHCDPFRSKLGEHPPSVVINAMMEFAALSSPASSAGCPSDDELWDQTLAERDRYHERADELAGAIAKHIGIDIGEHSNLNDPWQNALDAIASKEQP